MEDLKYYRTTTRRIVTTSRPKVGRIFEKEGYEYPRQESRLFPEPLPELPVTYLPPTARETFLPPLTSTTRR